MSSNFINFIAEAYQETIGCTSGHIRKVEWDLKGADLEISVNGSEFYTCIPVEDIAATSVEDLKLALIDKINSFEEDQIEPVVPPKKLTTARISAIAKHKKSIKELMDTFPDLRVTEHDVDYDHDETSTIKKVSNSIDTLIKNVTLSNKRKKEWEEQSTTHAERVMLVGLDEEAQTIFKSHADRVEGAWEVLQHLINEAAIVMPLNSYEFTKWVTHTINAHGNTLDALFMDVEVKPKFKFDYDEVFDIRNAMQHSTFSTRELLNLVHHFSLEFDTSLEEQLKKLREKARQQEYTKQQSNRGDWYSAWQRTQQNTNYGYMVLLGLTGNPTKREIKKAYRAMANKHHPDKGGDTDKFKEIKQAYEALIKQVS